LAIATDGSAWCIGARQRREVDVRGGVLDDVDRDPHTAGDERDEHGGCHASPHARRRARFDQPGEAHHQRRGRGDQAAARPSPDERYDSEQQEDGCEDSHR
jgi:hypothetical protein